MVIFQFRQIKTDNYPTAWPSDGLITARKAPTVHDRPLGSPAATHALLPKSYCIIFQSSVADVVNNLFGLPDIPDGSVLIFSRPICRDIVWAAEARLLGDSHQQDHYQV